MKKLFTYMLSAACSLTFMLNAVEPYDSIHTVAYEGYTLQDSYTLYSEVISQGTTVFIDVGSVDGAAARYIAANTNGSVRIYNVNSWGATDHSFQKFLSNVLQENQSQNITPIRMSALEASSDLNLVSECIFMDPTNADSIYDEILAWAYHLTPHGVIVGNHWEWLEVELEVVKAASQLNFSLTLNGTYWFLKHQ